MPCNPPHTNADKRWPYEEYYYGERDEENRKHGTGSYHWSGAESQEWYNGRMLRDTMHGDGEYHWRYLGPDHSSFTYEGRFYNNCMHGYGVMSYPDGRVFNGLWYKNFRWGPGVESHARVCEDVGLWYGCQLIRLTWRPPVPSVAIDLVSNPIGARMVAPHRVLLTSNVKIIGEVNSALELLKQYGCEPLTAAEKWTKLYPKTCIDLSSQLCHVEAFDRAYYDKQINTLDEVTTVKSDQNNGSNSENETEKNTYYAWNNNVIIIHMMKHCFTHEEQRDNDQVRIENIISGSRSSFKQAGKHELDCRLLLMASYLGHISNVAPLINECDVLPNVTDSQGNSVLMYAACGDQLEVIHFLVEAGAEIDAYNDACCTPLGITLIRYALEKHGVAYSAVLQALLPPPATGGQSPTGASPSPVPNETILEWKINRNLTIDNNDDQNPNKTSNKINGGKIGNGKEHNDPKKKTGSKIKFPKLSNLHVNASTDSTVSEDKRVYNNIKTEYLIKVSQAFSVISEVNPIPYIFKVHDMAKDIALLHGEEIKHTQNGKNVPRKDKELVKLKTSKDNMWQDKEDLGSSINNMKHAKLSCIMSTILQLLFKGADPRKVRCPQPPLLIATAASSAELIRHLVEYGADINEVYPQIYGYSTLDVAVSGPLTKDNLEVIRALFKCGADPDHRLEVPQRPAPQNIDEPAKIKIDEGPTLLHAVLAKKVEPEGDPQLVAIRDEILELLLQYGCNPINQYCGSSAVDMALKKSIDVFNIFLKNPRTDLNAVINDSNQTILVKMFHLPFSKTVPITERLQTLTNLLLFGADPLIKCRNGEEEYGNLFVFAKNTLKELYPASKYIDSTTTVKTKKKNDDIKSLAGLKKKKPAPPGPLQLKAKQTGKTTETDNLNDYKQALDLVVDCARLLYIRWLQSQLLKELIEVVNKYKHRHWNMILKEHKNKKCVSLWLTAVRSLEIWDVLKTTKKNIYNDEKVLKKVLCIVHFYFKRSLILRSTFATNIERHTSIVFQEKEFIEGEVARLMREHKIPTMPNPDQAPAMRPYVTPELTVKQVEKFNICFECAIPLRDEKIPCDSCKLVDFCTFDCMKTNIGRINCHPCSSYLKDKYFPTPEEAENNSEEFLF